MVAIVATSACFPVCSQTPNPGAKAAKFGGRAAAYFGGIMSEPASGRWQDKANAQAPFKINDSAVSLTKVKRVKNENDMFSSDPMTFIINQLSDWSILLATFTTMFLKPRRPYMVTDPFGLGIVIQDNVVSRQNFTIRSYEIGADCTASIDTLMNLLQLQETAVNHFKNIELYGEGFGSTPEMCKRNLIWVVTQTQVLVDQYPTCFWVLMHTMTRRLSRIPEEVRRELEPYFFSVASSVNKDRIKLPKLDEKTANCIRKGLTPGWSDLDLNQPVNNVKYIGWILETTPLPILESHELSAMTLEYRRECGRDSVLQSLTAVDELVHSGNIQCHHLLGLEDAAEIMRARTEWRPKRSNDSLV